MGSKTYLIILLLLVSTEVAAFTPSQHISISQLLNKEEDNKVDAFMKGFLSHALADSIEPQEYKFDFFHPSGNEDLMLLEGLLSLYQIYEQRNNPTQMWGTVGALAPDLIDGIASLIDKYRYNSGNHIMPFHKPHNGDTLGKGETMGLSTILFSINKKF